MEKFGSGVSQCRDVVPIQPLLCLWQADSQGASQSVTHSFTHRAQMPGICPLHSGDASPTRTAGSPKPAAKATPPAKSAAGRGRDPPAPGAGRVILCGTGVPSLGNPCRPPLASFRLPPLDEDWFSSLPLKSARCLNWGGWLGFNIALFLFRAGQAKTGRRNPVAALAAFQRRSPSGFPLACPPGLHTVLG